jgi:hypothetical protein
MRMLQHAKERMTDSIGATALPHALLTTPVPLSENQVRTELQQASAGAYDGITVQWHVHDTLSGGPAGGTNAGSDASDVTAQGKKPSWVAVQGMPAGVWVLDCSGAFVPVGWRQWLFFKIE